MSRKSKRHLRTSKTSFFIEFRFEIIVVTLFSLGVFLLVEDMQIKSGIYHFVLSVMRTATNFISTLMNNIVSVLSGFEGSDIVGIILITIAVVMVFLRIRYRILRRIAYLDECPLCGESLRRIHRTYLQKILGILLFAKIKHYSCKKCSFKGIKTGFKVQ